MGSFGGKGGGGGNIPEIDLQGLIDQQARVNRITQFTPTGNMIFGRVDNQGNFSPAGANEEQFALRIEETPFQQAARQGLEDLTILGQMAAAPRLQNLPLAPIDTTRMPALSGGLELGRVGFSPGAPPAGKPPGGGPIRPTIDFQRLPGGGPPSFAMPLPAGGAPGAGPAASVLPAGQPAGPVWDPARREMVAAPPAAPPGAAGPAVGASVMPPPGGGGVVPRGIDFGRLPGLPDANAPFGTTARMAADAVYNRSLERAQPALDRRAQRVMDRLDQQGIPIGSDAYARAVQETITEPEQAFLSDLSLGADSVGLEELNRLFGRGMTARQAALGEETTRIGSDLSRLAADLQAQQAAGSFSNAARSQAINEAQALRSGEMAELAALMGLTPVQPIGLGQFFSPSAIDVTGPAQLAQNSAIARTQASNAATGNMISALSGLGRIFMPSPF